MADDGPQLVRPIPRRPFDIGLTSATPPGDDSPTESSQDASVSPNHLSAAWERADAPPKTPTTPSASISRPGSFMNLTSSTLFGIYSPTASSRDRAFNDRDESDTPWGMGAQTPVKRPGVDDATYELMRERFSISRRRSSYKGGEIPRPPVVQATPLQLVVPAGLLFVLGVGYGVLVTRFHEEQNLAAVAENLIKPGSGYNAKYLTLWGVAGVALGSLLPWFDRVWEDAFGAPDDEDEAVAGEGEAPVSKELGPGTDWALVMRAIGAFVGIVFAIRKLAWSSTLQISATLAMVNPLLWWLIDRSKPGFLLSATVGLVGSVFLLGVSPDMMPAPAQLSSARLANATAQGEGASALGGLASNETIETGVWMLSVLFCSCLCFGNIGRRLSWRRSATGQGRWAGIR